MHMLKDGVYNGIQARSQKFSMGGTVLGVWGRSPQPPEANGDLRAKLSAAGGMGVKFNKFCIFYNNNLILGLFW